MMWPVLPGLTIQLPHTLNLFVAEERHPMAVAIPWRVGDLAVVCPCTVATAGLAGGFHDDYVTGLDGFAFWFA